MNRVRGPLFLGSALLATALLALGGRAAPLQAPPPLTGPGSGLVGYWALEEQTGTLAADSSGVVPANNGTHMNAPSISTQVPNPPVTFTTRSVSFIDANDTSIDVPDSPSLSLTGDLTIAAWVRPTATTGGQQGIVEKWDYSTETQNGYMLRLSPTLQLRFAVIGATGGPNDVTSSQTLALNAWTHVAGVYNATNQTQDIYIGGFFRGGFTSIAPPTDGAATLMIGNAQGANQFQGEIDDVRVYNRALDATELQALATGAGAPPAPAPPPGPPAPPPGPVSTGEPFTTCSCAMGGGPSLAALAAGAILALALSLRKLPA